jgi:hypothetical protein
MWRNRNTKKIGLGAGKGLGVLWAFMEQELTPLWAHGSAAVKMGRGSRDKFQKRDISAPSAHRNNHPLYGIMCY